MEANILGFNSVVYSVGGDVSVDSEACSDFVNLEDLSAQFSKMLIGVGFAALSSKILIGV